MNPFQIDIRTVLTLLFLGNLTILAILLAYVKGKKLTRTYYFFIAARALQALAWPLLSLRGEIPDLWSVYAGNSMLLFGFSSEALALSTLDGDSPRLEKTYLSIATASSVLFCLFATTPNYRVAMASLLTIPIYGLAAVLLFPAASASPLRKTICALCAVFCITLGMRSASAFTTMGDYALFSKTTAQFMSFSGAFLLMIVTGTGFILMAKELSDARLAESEEKYRTLVEKASEAILIIQDGKLVFANKRVFQFLKLEEQEIIGKPFIEAIHPDDREKAREQYKKRISGELASSAYDLRMINPETGEPVWVYVSSSRIIWKDEPAILTMLTNIDERKRLEEERERMIAQLQQAVAEVKTLTGLLPICASCKKIRDDNGYWQQVEYYIGQRTGAEFSHGICPECARRLYPEVMGKV